MIGVLFNFSNEALLKGGHSGLQTIQQKVRAGRRLLRIHCMVGNFSPSDLSLPGKDLPHCGLLRVLGPLLDLPELGVVEEQLALLSSKHHPQTL